MSAHRCSGDIVIIGSRVFFCPQNEELSYLEWEAEKQRFVLVQRDDRDVAPLFASEQTASGELEYGAVRIPCCALYGVIPLRATSILLYVNQQEHVATLPFSASHEVFAVKRFAWMRLPSPKTGSPVYDGLKEDDGGQNGSYQDLSEDILGKYCALIDRFCTESQQHSGGSYFFYSPTINLALDPCALAEGSTKKRFGASFSGNNVDGPKNTRPRLDDVGEHSLLAFQWNTPLLQAFTPLEVYSGGIFLYVPLFIRGLVSMSSAPSDGVQLLLINRLSYRWAGTRYNRRGLDLEGSGICANFSTSTLWVFSAEAEEQEKDASVASLNGEKRMASYQIIRGSIPLHWSQRANLAFTPEVSISSPARAVTELISHLKLLNKLLRGISTLHFIDTTSLSEVERPLSEAFGAAITKFCESDLRHDIPYDVHYTKYDFKDRMRRNLSYDEISKGLNELASGCVNGEVKRLDFTQWCRKPMSKEDGCLDVGEDDTRYFFWNKIHQQKHYVRVNCLDCLDRTNLVQSMIVVNVLPRMICYVRGEKSMANNCHNENDAATEDSDTEEEKYDESIRLCKELWAQQGIALSELYAGSEPHFLRFLLKGSLGPFGKQQEAILASRRWLQQNFYDGDKQDIISIVTRQHDPALVQSEFERRFLRPFSFLNKMVVLGLFVAMFALGVNLIVTLFVPRDRISTGPVLYSIAWVIYIGVLIFFIMRDGVSYTNSPLFR
ncbi:putative synaptojanin (N-terminal domain) [Trypanosoma cruzi]|nr:putative synaptojanin (N-terminal domain) [Trypanosoma cruzi]